MIYPRKILFACILGSALTSSSVLANDPECSSKALTQRVTQQTQEIDTYLSRSGHPQQSQQEMADMARGLRESGQVSDHSEEMKKLASGADFQPSRSFCNDLQITMDAVQAYMDNHPN